MEVRYALEWRGRGKNNRIGFRQSCGDGCADIRLTRCYVGFVNDERSSLRRDLCQETRLAVDLWPTLELRISGKHKIGSLWQNTRFKRSPAGTC